MMFRGRLQILPDRQEIDLRGAQIVHHLQHLGPFLAEPDHDPRFGETRRIETLGLVEQAQRMEIARARPHFGIKPWHGFEIVVEDIEVRAAMTVSIAPSLRRKSGTSTSIVVFGAAARMAAMVRAKWPAPPSSRSSRSTEVTTMCVKAERGDRVADPRRLMRVEPVGPAGRDIAEGAGAGAHRPQDHHRRVLLLPALADIGAGRLFAHRVEVELAHQPARRVVLGRPRRLDPNPRRLPRARIVRPRRLLRVAQRRVGGRQVIF